MLTLKVPQIIIMLKLNPGDGENWNSCVITCVKQAKMFNFSVSFAFCGLYYKSTCLFHMYVPQ